MFAWNGYKNIAEDSELTVVVT